MNYGAGEAEFFEDEKGVFNLVNMRDVWDISYVGSTSPERTGWPTQKPVALYDRFIQASSNKGDIVFDPFCGCATTLVAAEKAGRQWIGCDIWDKAYESVLVRLYREGLNPGSAEYKLSHKQLAEHMELSKQIEFWFNEYDVHYIQDLPIRTDDGTIAGPYLKAVQKQLPLEPPGPRMSRREMLDKLIEVYGITCMGCGRSFDDARYLDLDHNTPRADGGINHISNRLPLCGPCNREKSNTLTLSGLRRKNKQMGYLKKEIPLKTITL